MASTVASRSRTVTALAIMVLAPEARSFRDGNVELPERRLQLAGPVQAAAERQQVLGEQPPVVGAVAYEHVGVRQIHVGALAQITAREHLEVDEAPGHG